MTEVTKMETTAQPHGENLPIDPMVSMIERIAMDPQSDLSKLERMLEMKERIEARECRRAFDRAISEAKAEIGPIIKTGEVDYTNNKGDRTHFKHETLDGIARVVDPVLSQHGLSYRFRSHQESGQLHVTCIIAHRDGHSEENTLQGAPDTSGSKNSYQAVGSAATYLQRYSLKLALGLSAARDDDGKGAEDTARITEDQFNALRDLIERAEADEGKLLAYFKIDHLGELPAAKYGEADAMLRKKLSQKGAAQ